MKTYLKQAVIEDGDLEAAPLQLGGVRGQPEQVSPAGVALHGVWKARSNDVPTVCHSVQEPPAASMANNCAGGQTRTTLRLSASRTRRSQHRPCMERGMLACRFRMTIALTFLGMRTSSSWAPSFRLTWSPHNMHFAADAGTQHDVRDYTPVTLMAGPS